jgi:hypothetical protein
VNGANIIFKTSITLDIKYFKIEIVMRKKKHCYNNNIESKWTPIELIIKDIRVGKSQSFTITRIQFSIHL